MLFDDYRFYRQYTVNVQKLKKNKPYMQDLKPTKKRLDLFRELLTFCEKHAVGPREWVYTLFATRRFMYAPRLERSHLLSQKHLEKMKRIEDFGLFQKRLREAPCKELSPQQFDPNRDMSASAEELKASYRRRGDDLLCMDHMSETLGYHPKSEICRNCVYTHACARKLQRAVSFDILALRRGDITAEEAQRQAIFGKIGYRGRS